MGHSGPLGAWLLKGAVDPSRDLGGQFCCPAQRPSLLRLSVHPWPSKIICVANDRLSTYTGIHRSQSLAVLPTIACVGVVTRIGAAGPRRRRSARNGNAAWSSSRRPDSRSCRRRLDKQHTRKRQGTRSSYSRIRNMGIRNRAVRVRSRLLPQERSHRVRHHPTRERLLAFGRDVSGESSPPSN